MQADIFAKKKRNTLAFLLLLGAVTILAMIITEYNALKGFASIPKAIQWGMANFYPTAESLEKLPVILEKLQETLLVSIAATTAAAAFALLFSIFGSNTTRINPFFGAITRGIATVFRNIDVAAWALILLFSFGQSSLTGYFALFFGSFGFLTRAFTETIDEVSGGSVEALKATGAGYFSIIFQSVIPSSIPQLISWVLFMIETNIRSATLIGLLTGSGIGFTFNLYYKSLAYDTASLVVVVIIAAILLIEYASNYVRKVIL
ncbi:MULTISPECIES: ABC transporter permease [Cytobacillus]|uniref:PhnE/PtxC family ABC transporter permease n=1 Tax=Cytobacillus TaxID=2675230 RepID=UPI0001F45082|nr:MULTISPECIES: ABC transporter permease subunit [Cytobacillus]EFV76691.1 phosphonate ABC transporter [Bacillus sp. 2_A_57_CT2]MCM3243250.1 ABC transporter permease subunit [Cytobacillus oceanisediminis]MCM3401198.1 ABC transporter permease subunit [Cytobacillus oceanisediminis]MDK7665495.1 ABC transporter permease subunit [Cytobacillus oceanisediminis]QOK29213.1 ABC transporter permease subunit [Cytobacillus oceanisediminis]